MTDQPDVPATPRRRTGLLRVSAWKNKPRGVFDDWNPKVSCRGTGDPA